jgi:hypothetical protein
VPGGDGAALQSHFCGGVGPAASHYLAEAKDDDVFGDLIEL